MGCVYLARNTVNGKCYVGKTVKTMRVRKNWHKATAGRGEGWCFHRAIRKHGLDAFEWSVIAESDDPEELGRLECESIVKHNAKRPGGYNLTDGGDGIKGCDQESRARVVAFHKGRKRSIETRRRQSEAAKGNQKRLGAVLSEETKRKLSASLSGKKMSNQAKAKIGAAFRGKPKSPEQKAKMSRTRKLWWERSRAAKRTGVPVLFDLEA